MECAEGADQSANGDVSDTPSDEDKQGTSGELDNEGGEHEDDEGLAENTARSLEEDNDDNDDAGYNHYIVDL